jgi:hypothetical protein
MKLDPAGGDANDWFFLGMAEWHLDQPDRAREWYQHAAQWVEANKPQDDELRHIGAELHVLLDRRPATPEPRDSVPWPEPGSGVRPHAKVEFIMEQRTPP